MVHEKGFNFDDARLMRGAWRNEPNPDVCKVDYLECELNALLFSYVYHRVNMM